MTHWNWTKDFAKNMDAKTSLAAIFVLAIAMIALFAGADGIQLGVYLVMILGIVVILGFIESIFAKTQEARMTPRRLQPKLVANDQQFESKPHVKLPAPIKRSEVDSRTGSVKRASKSR